LKGALQDGDKLVIYAVKGATDSYRSDPYTKAAEFSKAELEAATVTPKSFDLPNDGDAAYIRRIWNLPTVRGTILPTIPFQLEGA
jgi:hypothetical protein